MAGAVEATCMGLVFIGSHEKGTPLARGNYQGLFLITFEVGKTDAATEYLKKLLEKDDLKTLMVKPSTQETAN